MNFSRITPTVDVARLAAKTVAIIGIGGGRDLAVDLVRCGVRRVKLFDLDLVEPANLARQGFAASELGLTKVEATAASLRAIDANVQVSTSTADFTEFSDTEIDDAFGDVDLVILATDRFAAQAKGNEVALRLGIDAVWIGLYADGLGGEIVFWHPEIDACYRCLCAKRYRAHAAAAQEGRSLDPPSTGVTILDVHLVDAIAGQLALGLLTRGSATRYGRLIEELGDRNFVQVKIDPRFALGGRDIVRVLLGVAENNRTFFAWNTVVRSDPDGGQLPCPDCQQFRGHEFTSLLGAPIRLKPGRCAAT